MHKIFSLNNKIAFVLGGSGLIGLEVIKSLNYAEHKIRINNICPGGVLDKTQLKNKLYKKFLRNYSNCVPMKRLANPKKIVMPITFLASDVTSYITGETLVVDGGWTII